MDGGTVEKSQETITTKKKNKQNVKIKINRSLYRTSPNVVVRP